MKTKVIAEVTEVTKFIYIIARPDSTICLISK